MPGWNKTCESSNCEQHQGNGGIDCGIERSNFIEQIAHQPTDLEARYQAHAKPKDRGQHSIDQHLPQDVLTLGAQRETDTDFGRPLPCDVGHDPEQSHGCQKQ